MCAKKRIFVNFSVIKKKKSQFIYKDFQFQKSRGWKSGITSFTKKLEGGE